MSQYYKKQTTPDFYKNHNENTALQFSNNMEISRAVNAPFCNFELYYRPMHENQLRFFDEKRELKFLWCVSDEFEKLQGQKPGRDGDDWENGSLTESFRASIEKENALDPKFGNKNWTRLSPFRVFLQKLDKTQ